MEEQEVRMVAWIAGAVFSIVFESAATAQGTGHFEGEVKTRWLGDGRKMELLEDFVYYDPDGARWIAPKGSIIDGASIPRVAWPLNRVQKLPLP